MKKLKLKSKTAKKLKGEVIIPGDKSISHRALIISSLAQGKSKIKGILRADDVKNTAISMLKLGIEIEEEESGDLIVNGKGLEGFSEPGDILYMGNSGTGARLLTGALSTFPFNSFISGDASLRKRPMDRVLTPLKDMGANIISTSSRTLPIAITASNNLKAIKYTLPVSSAQVKSAILLAGLNVDDKTVVTETSPSRDHTENLLKAFGANIKTDSFIGGGKKTTLIGKLGMKGGEIIVPGDFSSAAFLIGAALIVPKSEILIKNVCINPLRTGLLETLKEMNANITVINETISGKESIADILVKHSELKETSVPALRAPSMIDEYPILAVIASFAKGKTTMSGLGELKVKESNRLDAIVKGLKACGVTLYNDNEHTLIIEGKGEAPKGGALVETFFDHRIAMSFLVMGMASKEPIEIDDSTAIGTSFPQFINIMNTLGANIS